MIDNRPNAKRLAATGGGIALPPDDVTPETSRAAVERLLSAELMAGARLVRDQIASLPARDAAVAALAALRTG
jgi:UDP:flavonoid glycosyltransferase YjiC (YdhE family)